jgi:type I restriction enzyme S subunit
MSARLGDLATKVGSGATPKGGEAAYKATGTPLIRSMNVVFFGFKWDGLAYLDDAQAEALKAVEVQAHDVLLNITGASIGRVTLAPSELAGARVNQHVCIIRPVEELDPRFLNAYLSSPPMQGAITNENYGVTRQALTKQQILDFDIPVAPRPEQKRIADKLDALIARVGACRERLDRVPGILKRFRQSVLAAATSGELTREWREERGRLLVHYKLRPIGKLVREPLRNGKSVRDGDGPMVLRLSSLRNGSIDWREAKPGDWGDIDVERFLVEEGDFLVARGNGSRDLVGRGGLVLGSPPRVAFPDTMIRVRPDPACVAPQFLKLVWDAESTRNQIEFAARTTAGIWKVAQPDLEAVTVPTPALDEQAEIVRRTSELFNFADRLDAHCNAARSTVERIAPSALAKAFRGELVPQDPNDEPASQLLARLHTLVGSARKTGKPKRSGARDLRTKTKTDTNVLTRKDVTRTHLTTILKERGALTAEALWTASQLGIDDFYDQLKDEEARGLLRENRGDAPNAPRLLEPAA